MPGEMVRHTGFSDSSDNTGGGIGVVAQLYRGEDGVPISLVLREGVPGAPERVDHPAAALALRVASQELQGGEEGAIPAPAVIGLDIGEGGGQGERSVALAIGQASGDQDVHRAGSQALGGAVGDGAGAVGAVDEVGGVIGRVDQRDGQDAHQRAVALAVRVGASLLRGHAPAQAREGGSRGIADVETALAVRRLGAGIGPGQEAVGLVIGVEADAAQRVEQRQRQRAIVAPGARLGPTGGRAPHHLADVLGALEFVRDGQGVAHEDSVDAGAKRVVSGAHGSPSDEVGSTTM